MITEDAKRESQMLVDKIVIADHIDITKEVKEIDEKKLKAHSERERCCVIGDGQGAMKWKNEEDILASQKANLIIGKGKKCEDARRNYDKFHAHYKEEFLAGLRTIGGKLERMKTFTVLSRGESNFVLPVSKVRTNLISILLALKNLAWEIEWFKNTRASLEEMEERYELIEKNTFPKLEETIISIFGDGELGNFRMLFPNTERYNDPTWQPAILGEETYDSQLNLVFQLQKEKVIRTS